MDHVKPTPVKYMKHVISFSIVRKKAKIRNWYNQVWHIFKLTQTSICNIMFCVWYWCLKPNTSHMVHDLSKYSTLNSLTEWTDSGRPEWNKIECMLLWAMKIYPAENCFNNDVELPRWLQGNSNKRNYWLITSTFFYYTNWYINTKII